MNSIKISFLKNMHIILCMIAHISVHTKNNLLWFRVKTLHEIFLQTYCFCA